MRDPLQQITETLKVSRNCKGLIYEVARVREIARKHLYVTGTYQSPSEKLNEALDIVSNSCEVTTVENYPTVIMGEINVNNELEEMFASYNVMRLRRCNI